VIILLPLRGRDLRSRARPADLGRSVLWCWPGLGDPGGAAPGREILGRLGRVRRGVSSGGQDLLVDLAGVSEAERQAGIDAGQIQATGRYVGLNGGPRRTRRTVEQSW